MKIDMISTWLFIINVFNYILLNQIIKVNLLMKKTLIISNIKNL